MSENRVRRGVWIPVLGFLLALGSVVVALEMRRSPQSAQPAMVSVPLSRVAKPQSQPQVSSSRHTSEPDPVPYIENQVWGDIDLREVQAAMPDNLYWKLGAPTNDPAVLEEREKEKAKRNEEYGRVLSGDASEEEVHAYYDYRKQLSTDYLEFSDYMRRRFDSSLSEEFKGMLELARNLHTAKLARLPAEEEAALEHARERAKIRQDWEKQKAEFGDVPPQPDVVETPEPAAE